MTTEEWAAIAAVIGVMMAVLFVLLGLTGAAVAPW